MRSIQTETKAYREYYNDTDYLVLIMNSSTCLVDATGRRKYSVNIRFLIMYALVYFNIINQIMHMEFCSSVIKMFICDH